MLPQDDEYSWKQFFKYLNTADIDAAKLKQLKDEVIRNLNSGGIPEGHYIQSPPSYIRRKLVTAGFAKGLGDELQEILGWAINSSYISQEQVVYSNPTNVLPLFSRDSKRLMLSGDRPSALRAIFMMMYANNVGGRSAVGYVGPGGKYYLALRPQPRPVGPGGGRILNRLKNKPITRKNLRKKHNTKNKHSNIKLKMKKKLSRAKKRIYNNSRHKPYSRN